jgi:hypothetical protein
MAKAEAQPLLCSIIDFPSKNTPQKTRTPAKYFKTSMETSFELLYAGNRIAIGWPL